MEGKKPAEIAQERCLPVAIPTGLREEEKEEFLEKQNALIFQKNLDRINNQIRKLNNLINEIIPEFSDSYRDNKALPRRPREYDYQTRIEIAEREFIKSLNTQEKRLFDFLRYREYIPENESISYISDIYIGNIKEPTFLPCQEISVIPDSCVTKKDKVLIKQEIIPFTTSNKSEIQLIIAQAKQGIFNKLETADIIQIYQQLYQKIKGYIPEITRGYKEMKPAINIDSVKKRVQENQEKTQKVLDFLAFFKMQIKENSTKSENQESQSLIDTEIQKSKEFQAIQKRIAEMYEIQGKTLNGIIDYCNNQKIPNVIAKKPTTTWNFKHIQKILDITEKNGKIIKEKRIIPVSKKTEYNQGIDKTEHDLILWKEEKKGKADRKTEDRRG